MDTVLTARCEGLLAALQAKRLDRLRTEQKLRGKWPRKIPIASDVDERGCKRRAVLEIVAWDKKPPPEPELLARFEVGTIWEREGIRRLMEDGFNIVDTQTRFSLKHRNTDRECLAGRIDGAIGGRDFNIDFDPPFEVKSLHPNVYARVDTIEDFNRMRFFRKYPSQLQSYLIARGQPWGFFWVTDCMGHWKPIPMELDEEKAEAIWSFAEGVVDAVEAHREDPKALPDYHDDADECRTCWAFGSVCNPPLDFSAIPIIDDAELVALLKDRERLQPASKEFDNVDEIIKKRLRYEFDVRAKLLQTRTDGADKLLVGPFEIGFKEFDKKGFVVAPATIQRIKITRVVEDAPAPPAEEKT